MLISIIIQMTINWCVLGTTMMMFKSKLLSNVHKVIKWFESNHMKVNEDTLQYIVFGEKDNLGNLICQYVKLLGLHVDRKINCKTHISNY